MTDMPQEPPAASSLAEVIQGEGGRVTFARFMEAALTHPTLGYYSQVERLLQRRGDFSTAPALSAFFNRTLARLVTELMDAGLETSPSGTPSIVELGGGEGQLAESILRLWEEERPLWRGKIAYRIVEVGQGLRRKQAAAVERITSRWDVAWGPDLEQACAGTRPLVMVGNEFLDAMPVHLVDVSRNAVRELHVRSPSDVLRQEWGELSPEAAAEIEVLFGTLDPARLRAFTMDGMLEVRPQLGLLLQQMGRLMSPGSLVSVDYGEWFPGVPPVEETWRLERRAPRRRSVRGYFRHQLVDDPLVRPGQQDLTADVDFAAVDFHGRQEGFETVLFTSLAAFLRGGGADDELSRLYRGTVASMGTDASASDGDPLETDRRATVLRALVNEDGLGGTFKLMLQVRG